ncbi:cytochrome P450 [Pelagicoccus sp. SDUM812003]|uniref:cytochrome P450 n=1 Tax=Pelagicoccus sp. SDUM812003 TaxID=3041267 RepID=UPI00280CFA62|nr:cytochrome P450 [Pelagicoccus sp. SDUM812003]MDQ8201456.1 cytochrome P450 [Pelagicoccus sp. SDUM812003]
MSELHDPFKEAKEKGPILVAEFQGEKIPMILKLKDIREATKDTETYSSDAPRRVPIPSEEDVRTVRQYPLEVDPPVHAEHRKIVEPFFLRPKLPEYEKKLNALIDRLIDEALERETLDVVHDFAIPLQSHALTYLLNVDEKEAELWIGWGIHVFKDGDGKSKGPFMEKYSEQMFLAAEKNPGEDFFSALNQAKFDGRKLTMEEKLGYANIAFAGGRDTIIHTAVNIVDYFAGSPKGLECVREHPQMVKTAAEEFFRVFIPLTHIGRVCPHDTNVHGHEVKAGGRVSLCWSSANRDPEVFKEPNEVKLDRKPNPHVAFGFGPHNCLGAHHARAIMRSLILKLAERVERIEVLRTIELVEHEKEYSRKVGYELLEAKFTAR